MHFQLPPARGRSHGAGHHRWPHSAPPLLATGCCRSLCGDLIFMRGRPEESSSHFASPTPRSFCLCPVHLHPSALLAVSNHRWATSVPSDRAKRSASTPCTSCTTTLRPLLHRRRPRVRAPTGDPHPLELTNVENPPRWASHPPLPQFGTPISGASSSPTGPPAFGRQPRGFPYFWFWAESLGWAKSDPVGPSPCSGSPVAQCQFTFYSQIYSNSIQNLVQTSKNRRNLIIFNKIINSIP
jgi:hypothetical protein